MAAAVYDSKNMAILLAIIDAVQPHDAVSQYQQMDFFIQVFAKYLQNTSSFVDRKSVV